MKEQSFVNVLAGFTLWHPVRTEWRLRISSNMQRTGYCWLSEDLVGWHSLWHQAHKHIAHWLWQLKQWHLFCRISLLGRPKEKGTGPGLSTSQWHHTHHVGHSRSSVQSQRHTCRATQEIDMHTPTHAPDTRHKIHCFSLATGTQSGALLQHKLEGIQDSLSRSVWWSFV